MIIMVHELINEKYKKINELTQLFKSKNLSSVKRKVKSIEKKIMLPNDKIIEKTPFLKKIEEKEKIVEMVKKGELRQLINSIDAISKIEEYFNLYSDISNKLKFYYLDKLSNYYNKDSDNSEMSNKVLECEKVLQEINCEQLTIVDKYSNFKIDSKYNFNEVIGQLNDWGNRLIDRIKKLPPNVTFEIPYQMRWMYQRHKINEMLKRDALRNSVEIDENTIKRISKNREKDVNFVTIIAPKIAEINPLFIKILEEKQEPFKEMIFKLKNLEKFKLLSKSEYLEKIRKLQLLKNRWNKG